MKPGPRHNSNMHYAVKSVLFDVDNTLVGNQSQGLPTERFTRAVESARGKVKIGLATARPLAQVEHILRHIHAEGLSILCNGAQIIDSASRAVVAEWIVKPETCREIISRVQSAQIPYLVSDDGDDFFPGKSDPDKYEKLSDMWDDDSARIPANDFSFGKTFNIVLHNITDAQLRQAELLMEGLDDDMVALLVGHQTIQPNGTKVYDVFICHKRANKKDALSYIIEAEGLNLSEIMFVGDGKNDALLVGEAGVGIAMGNSVQETLDAATFVTANQENDGAAIALEYAVSNF
jgi:Cof subfamily protein (haloacid dehalogenase superfamily)